MASLNVFEPIFRNYYIFGTQTDQQNQLKIFLCEVFFLYCFKFCFVYK